MGQPAARITDMHTCPMAEGPVPHVGGPVIAGEPTVLIGGLPAARVGDMVTCAGPPDTIATGAETVIIGGMSAARMGDSTAHGGVIVGGCPTVFIGDTPGASTPIKNPTIGPPLACKCWPKDYVKNVNVNGNARYFKKYKADGTKYSNMPPKFVGKIYVPVKTGHIITVEVKFKAQALGAVAEADLTSAKTKLETGVSTHWNNKFKMVMVDTKCTNCGKKYFKIQYKVKWVDSGQDYTIKVHDTYPREGVTGNVMDVSKATSKWVYAHEFGHCVGLPDEYSYVPGSTETVKYIKPDGRLDTAISAPYNGKSKTAPDATIMAAFDNTTTLTRHAWNIAIEVQELLTSELGRNIKCTIT